MKQLLPDMIPDPYDSAAAKAPKPPGRKARKAVAGGAPADMVANLVETLTERIVAGDYGTHGQLPAEGELSGMFGVSRTVVREAMRILRASRLVEMSQGKPARVTPPDSGGAVASLDLLLRRKHATLIHLAEVRRPLESEIAALAADRRNDVHLGHLERAVHDLATAPGLAERIEADQRFHCILAEATGNPVFVILLETLAGFLQKSRQKTLTYSGAELAVAGHQAILAAVRAGDAEAASRAMHDHLKLATSDLMHMPD